MLCAYKIMYVSGKTYGLTSIPNERFFYKLFTEILNKILNKIFK